jgi:hypothetical protein
MAAGWRTAQHGFDLCEPATHKMARWVDDSDSDGDRDDLIRDSDDRNNIGKPPSAAVAAELQTAGAGSELGTWQVAASRLDELQASLARAQAAEAQARAECKRQKAGCTQQRATVRAAAAAAHTTLHARRVRHNESCKLLQLVSHEDLRPTFMRAEVWGVLGLWRLRGVCPRRRWICRQCDGRRQAVCHHCQIREDITLP